MTSYYDGRFKKTIYDISPGDFFVSSDSIIISTVLGSCISVLIHDRVRKMGGLNHFMLAHGKESDNDLLKKERYGLYAMESLLNGFYKTGSLRSNLSAKMFGGSSVLAFKEITNFNIGEKNALYAREFLKNEEIPLVAEDIGGNLPRRLYLEPDTFKVYVRKKKFDPVQYEKLIEEMAEYKTRVDKTDRTGGEIVLFDNDLYN